MCNSRTRNGLFILLILFVVAAPVEAQDMQFGMQEAGAAPVGPPAEGPPSESLAMALRLYTQEQHQEAAVQFQRVVEGQTQDAPANVQKAQFFLGKSLFHLHYYQSALAVFDEISEMGRSHIFFDQTLQWLAQLAAQLPEPAGIIDKVGRFGVEQLEQFNTADNAVLYNRMLYLMGRSKYNQGEFEQAIKLLNQVSKDSQFFVQARFFEGISYIRLRKAKPASAAFRDILKAIDSDEVEGIEDEERMRDLALISLARVYYTAANRVNEGGERKVDGKLLGGAVEAWNEISPKSEYWLDSLFEASWAFFLADEFSRALGNIHTLYSPYFTGAFYPEAMVLKAVVFFSNCQMENASAVVQQFHERYDPVKQKLEEILQKYKDNAQFFEFLKQVREGRANLPIEIQGVVESALSDRTVLANLEYVALLEQQEKELSKGPAQFRGSSLGGRILQDILVAKSFAIDQTGDIAKARYDRLIRDMQDLSNQIDTVEIEILNHMRGQLSAELQQQQSLAGQSTGGRVEVDSEHVVWPFKGEYWRDELGYYRQEVTFMCGR
ncbi:MAG: tetratricopeptide repeat protein [Deltaproteobacteria bacterium]|nr:tetratricopeptide repeat protein [Deltaproteobacteria bacterium]